HRSSPRRAARSLLFCRMSRIGMRGGCIRRGPTGRAVRGTALGAGADLRIVDHQMVDPYSDDDELDRYVWTHFAHLFTKLERRVRAAAVAEEKAQGAG